MLPFLILKHTIPLDLFYIVFNPTQINVICVKQLDYAFALMFGTHTYYVMRQWRVAYMVLITGDTSELIRGGGGTRIA